MASSEAQSINSYIRELDYDPKEVLIFEGNTCEDFVPVEGEDIDSTYVVTKREKCTMTNNFDIFECGKCVNIAYPGALVLCDSNLVDNNPTPVIINRNSQNYSVNLPSGTKKFSVEHPESYSNVMEVLDNCVRGNESDFTRAEIQYNKTIVTDEKSLALSLGCDVNYLKNKIGIDFEAIKSGKKSSYMIQYKQVYYTVSADLPINPSDLFSEDVIVNDLVDRNVNNSHPLGFVSNVNYGRTLYVSFTSQLNEADLSATINAAIENKEVDVSIASKAEYNNKDTHIYCDIVMLGGNAESFTFDMTEDNFVDKINSMIEDGLVYNEDTAYPVSYNVNFVDSNSVAVVNGSTEYIKTTVTEYHTGELKLIHTGAFVARFYVDYDEITGYDADGKTKYDHKDWDGNGEDKTAKWETIISLNAKVRNIHVKAQGCTGLAWDWWRTPVDQYGIPLMPHIEAKITGTTLNQSGYVKYWE